MVAFIMFFFSKLIIIFYYLYTAIRYFIRNRNALTSKPELKFPTHIRAENYQAKITGLSKGWDDRTSGIPISSYPISSSWSEIRLTRTLSGFFIFQAYFMDVGRQNIFSSGIIKEIKRFYNRKGHLVTSF